MWPTGNKTKSGCSTGLRNEVRVQRLPKQLEIEGGKSQKGGSQSFEFAVHTPLKSLADS